MLGLPDRPLFAVIDTETSGLHPDDGARVACVSVTFPDRDVSGWLWQDIASVLQTVAFPFDQGVRDKFEFQQFALGLFGEEEDPNLGENEWMALLSWLDQQDLIFHNAPFDLKMMCTGTRHWRGMDLSHRFRWDTMMANRVMDPLHEVGLESSCERHALGAKKGVDALTGWLTANKYPKRRYDLVPWGIAEPYVKGDTEMTAALYLHQRQRIAEAHAPKRDAWDTRIREKFDLLIALYHMEQRGICYDEIASLEAAERLEAQAREIEERLPFPATDKGAKAYFFGKLQLHPDRRTEKRGDPCLDEEQVRKFIKEDIPWAAEYAEITKKRRAVSMWYRGYPEKIGQDGRLRTTYKPTAVKSGRMSVERVQLQAMPKKDKNIEGIPGVRTLIHPDEGMGLWNLDLSQAELRVAAKYADCRQMLKMLSEGADLHAHTCRGTMQIQDDHPLWKEKRDIAKRLNFGGIFMIGWETFQATMSKLADIHLDEQECRKIVNAWRRMYPEFSIAYTKAQSQARKHKWVEVCRDSPYARKSWFGPRDWPNSAWNREVQGSLAEVFGVWLGQTEKRWPGYMVLTVHDSILLEAPLDEGDQVSQEVAEYGALLFTDAFQIEMKVDVDRWGR